MKYALLCLMICLSATASAFTRQDSLRGSNGRGRSWWDVQKYALTVYIDLKKHEIIGQNEISFIIEDTPNDSLQLDLRQPMVIDSIRLDGKKLIYANDGDVIWVDVSNQSLKKGDRKSIFVTYHGEPKTAANPPWDGGFVWAKDINDRDWIAVACQGTGASCWWPCKDYQGDEPDSSTSLEIGVINDTGRIIPHYGIDNTLKLISNGKYGFSPHDLFAGKEQFFSSSVSGNGIKYFFKVINPINTYNTTFYLGDYVSWTDTFQGVKGTLDLSFHCLRYNEEKARKQFAVTKEMLRCFEWWMGPYPFYEDGYKLVEAPYLGMEHQSAVAYGNQYKMGYLGHDRSGTGVGMLFDYIIIHESGHEWFGNSITAQDIADNWIHEGFTTYTETLFAEWIAGKDAARRYSIGERRTIENDRPVIGTYGVNDEGSGDKYDKGASIVHMIRTMMHDDEAFRRLLRGLNDTFYHKIVTTAQVEAYIQSRVGGNLKPFFDQYLRTRQIPELQWYRKEGQLYTRFTNTVDGFSLPLFAEGNPALKIPTSTDWTVVPWTAGKPQFAKDFLMTVTEVKAPK